MRRARWFGIVALIWIVPAARAHPVPKSSHDRTIVVHLDKSAKPNHLAIRIEYTLEVDELTVLLEDMLPFKDEVNFSHFKGNPLGYYKEYARIYAPILADRLLVKWNGKSLSPTCKADERSQHLVDKDKQPLGHLRCEFVFCAEAAVAVDQEVALLFRESNFLLQEGQIRLSFANDASVKVRSVVAAPDEALQKRPPTEQKPEDDAKLRELKVAFTPGADSLTPPPVEPPPKATPPPEAVDNTGSSVFHDGDSLLWLLRGDMGFWLTLLLVTILGAFHALTPGHGKTLVAAYLIGQRGTAWHALILGIITTVTHTGAILVLAAVMFFLPEHLHERFKQWLAHGLGFVAGIIIVCLGFWLLLQRLAGRADHVHFGGRADHSHGHGHEHGHSHSHGFDIGDPNATGVRWGTLLVMGVTGGLIPCGDAVGVFLYYVFHGEFWMVLPALVCFSAGLAGVLVLIGILVVRLPGFAKSHLGEGRFVKSLPIVSAVVIILMGFWMCWKGT